MTYVSVSIDLDDVTHGLLYGSTDDEDIQDFIVAIDEGLGDEDFTIGLMKTLFDSLSDDGKHEALDRLQ